MITPELAFVADLVVQVGAPITIGETAHGLRRLIPIVGGTIRGDRLRGSILPGGDDAQIIGADGFTRLDARYAARTDDGDMLYIVNSGVRFGDPAVMARLTRGEPVDPALVYFRTTPRFESAAVRLAWLTRPLFVATGARAPDTVTLRVFELT